jgi:hypothetical protein
MAHTHHISALIEHLKMNVSKFEREIGVGASTISKAIDRNTALGFGTVQKILDKYPHVNKTWLETGEGEMLTKAADRPASYIDQLLAAKDALLAEKDKRIEREMYFTDTVMTNFERYDQEIADYRKWQIEVGQSILSLTKAVAPLLGKDQKKAVGQQVVGKQRI